MNLYSDLAAKIAASGFTVTAVCDRANVSSGTPTHWKAGRTSPNQSTYHRMIEALSLMCSERADNIKKAGIV